MYVITDSTADLPPDSIADAGIRVVPLHVVVGGTSKVEDREIGPGEVAASLRQHVPVSTSRPSPEEFLEAYRKAADDGATGVVSVHLSSKLSGTVDAARLAASQAPLPVTVVDSGLLAMGLGFAVQAAAAVAAQDGTMDDVVAAAMARSSGTSAFFYVDTLEYLRRGGRIGAASALLGTALSIKPLLHLVDGAIEPLEKVRTSARAVARLADLAVQRAGDAPVDVAVHHLAAAERAERLAAGLSERVPNLGELLVAEVGAVIGAHVGPGLLAVVISPRSEDQP